MFALGLAIGSLLTLATFLIVEKSAEKLTQKILKERGEK